MPSQKLIEELQTIIEEDYGRKVSFQEASLIARDVVGYFDTLARMYHEQQEKKEEL